LLTAFAAALAFPGTLVLRQVTETEEASASSSLPALAGDGTGGVSEKTHTQNTHTTNTASTR
jgi:hypothetical protein